MTKLLLSIIASLSIYSKTVAQVIVNYNQKNPYEFKLNTVSEFNLINAGSNMKVNVKVELLQGQKQIYSCNYLNLTCNNGNNSYPLIQPSNEVKNNSIPGLATNGFLPSGQYELCFTVTDETKQEEFAQNCFDISIKSLSPPFLIYPNDVSTINNLTPTLIWSPPLGSNINERYKYDLKLVKIQNNQQPIDAINQNYATLKLQDLNSTQLLYPFNAAKLVNGKNYSWQVIAKNDNGYKAETEVWTFSVKLDSLSEEKVVFFEGFVLAKKTPVEGVINLKEELKLYFNESFQLKNLDFQLLSDNQTLISKLEPNSIKELGSNKFNIKFEYIPQLIHKKVYFLNIVNQNNSDTYQIKFKCFKH